MYDIDNLSCIIRAETLHIANDDQRIQTGKEREREEGRERKSEREKRERKKTRTSRLAHGGLIRSSLLTLLPAARLLCTDGERESESENERERERQREREREQRRPLRSPSGTSSPTKRTEPASIPPLRRPNSHPLTFPLSPADHQPPFFATAISSLSLSCSSHN